MPPLRGPRGAPRVRPRRRAPRAPPHGLERGACVVGGPALLARSAGRPCGPAVAAAVQEPLRSAQRRFSSGVQLAARLSARSCSEARNCPFELVLLVTNTTAVFTAISLELWSQQRCPSRKDQQRIFGSSRLVGRIFYCSDSLPFLEVQHLDAHC